METQQIPTPTEAVEKTSTILSILKWYSIVVMTLGSAMIFVEWANYGDGESFLTFLFALPIPVYLWSLVVRKRT